MFYSGIADEAGETIAEQIRAHQELGWKHLELRMIEGENITRIADDKFKEVAEKLEAAHIKVSCFASKLGDWSRKISDDFAEDVKDLQTAIPRMKGMGTEFIRAMSWPNDGWSDEDWKKEAIRRMRELVRLAEEGGVTIVHENCSGWGGRPETCRELVETMDSPHFRIVYDTGNPPSYGQDGWEFYQAVRPYIVYVHIKDSLQGKGTYTFCGEGDGRVEDILRHLLDSGYQGGISIEPHLANVLHDESKGDGKKDPFQAYVEYGRRLENIIEKIRRG